MSGDSLDALRGNLAQQSGRARARPLLELGQALTERYRRTGPGSPEAQPFLDEAIQVLVEAHGYLEPGGSARSLVAGQLGWLVGTRHIVDGSPEHDRDQAISLIDEALGFPQLPQMARIVGLLTLGQLLMGRLMCSMRSSDFVMRAMRSGLSTDEKADVDRAVECFRQVVVEAPETIDITRTARAMLDVAEALQSLAPTPAPPVTSLSLAAGRAGRPSSWQMPAKTPEMESSIRSTRSAAIRATSPRDPHAGGRRPHRHDRRHQSGADTRDLASNRSTPGGPSPGFWFSRVRTAGTRGMWLRPPTSTWRASSPSSR
jgi:hypothetical protein